MFSLVTFTEDKIWFVCHTNHIRKNRKQKTVAKWIDERVYEASVITTSNEKLVLEGLCDSLNNNTPVVMLEKLNEERTDWRYSNRKSDSMDIPDLEHAAPFGSWYRSDNLNESEQQSQQNTIALRERNDESYNERGNSVCPDCGTHSSDLGEHLCFAFTNDEANESTCSTSNKYDLCWNCGMLCLDLLEHLQTVHDSQETFLGNNIDADTAEKKSKIYKTKQHFCIYCETLQFKLARHLQNRHPEEEDVEKAVTYEKGSRERREAFLSIQKKGDYLYRQKHSKTISLRRSESARQPCPLCKGFYSPKNLRNHVRLYCPKKKEKNSANLPTMSRALMPHIHEKASKVLKEEIFARMTDDYIKAAISHDEIVIKYADWLVMKYRSSVHHQPQIRNKIRHISRILLTIRSINPNITDTMSIYNPSHFDSFVEAIHKLAGYRDGKYDVPSLGPSSVTLMNDLGDFLSSEAIKRKDDILEKNVERFLKLLNTSSNALINKTAIETRTQQQRSKSVTLPKTDDVKVLYTLLNNELNRLVTELEEKFCFNRWSELKNKVVLIKLMTFNRKRPGDIEKAQLVEYDNLQIAEDSDIEKLDAQEKKVAKFYGRFITRGKLNSPASVFVSKVDMKAISILRRYRSHAGVTETNPYLFATAGVVSDPYFKAAKALKDFCCSHGLQNKNLTATNLRKHLATATCGLEKDKQAAISDFMGHAINIHNKIYKQPPVIHDVILMGKVLEDVIGIDDSDKTIVESNSISIEVFQKKESEVVNRASSSQSQSMQEESSDNEIINRNDGAVSRDDEKSSEQDYCPDLSTIIEEEENLNDEINNRGGGSFSREEENSTSDDNCFWQSKQYSSSESSDFEVTKSKRSVKLRSKKRRSTKTTWTTPERHAMRSKFQYYLKVDSPDIPSLETCQEFCHGEAVLENRSPLQVRSWIVNEKKRMLQGDRKGWTTPAKQLCRRIFKDYYKTRVYPSSEEILEAINKYDELRNTNVAKVKSHLQHDFKYVHRKRLDF